MLALEFNTMDNFLNANYNELVKIQNIGDITAKEIITFINDENIVSGINLLISKGIVIISDNVEKTDLTGKKIVITGSIEGINRKDLESRLENLGASISSSVSKNTDFLIIGKKPGKIITACHADHNVPNTSDSKTAIEWIMDVSFEEAFEDRNP